MPNRKTGERTGSRPSAAEGGGASAPALRPSDHRATSPQLLMLSRVMNNAKLGRKASRGYGLMSIQPSLRGASATWQSRVVCVALDCRVALLLAMTEYVVRDSNASIVQLGTRHQDVARELAGAEREFVAEPARGGGVAFQHALEQAAGDADDCGIFQRGRRRGTAHRNHQGELTDQRAGPGRNLGGLIIDAERAALHDIAAVGLVALGEQRVATGHVALLGADREHAQRGAA